MTGFIRDVITKVTHLPDHLLVSRAKVGDREAFGKLYLKYLNQIYRYIFFRVDEDRATAEDLTQIVFFKSWASLPDYKTNGSFSNWLYRIAANSVIDYHRKRQDLPLTENVPDRQNIEEQATYQDEVNGLHQAMKQLTDEQKTVVTLKFIEGLGNQEIANIMDKKEEAVRALQSRALKKLRQLLEAYE